MKVSNKQISILLHLLSSESVVREELVRRVHTLFVRSAQQVQVVYELQVLEEEERGA